jgi:arylsulfatase A-like enzyme
MKPPPSARPVCIGAAQGAAAWLAYAATEAFFISVLPWIIQPAANYKPVNRGFTFLLFVLYPAVGLALGSLSGLAFLGAARKFPSLANRDPAPLLRVAAVFTLLLSSDVNTVIELPAVTPSADLRLLASLLTALVLAAEPSLSGPFRFLGNPWIVSAVLTGLPWITDDWLADRSQAIKTASGAAFFVVVILLAFAIQEAPRRRRLFAEEMEPAHSASTAQTAAAAAAVLALSLSLRQQPRAAAASQTVFAPDPSRPNIVLITMDTVRADHLSVYGYGRKTTPQLQALAPHATLYTNAVAPSGMTLSSHGSLFTGVYASRHGAHPDPASDRSNGLAGRFPTLAALLAAHGYLTMAVVANYMYLNDSFGLDRGFQYFDNRFPVPFLERQQPCYLRRWVWEFLVRFTPPAARYKLFRQAEEITRQASALLAKRKHDRRPFFLFLNYMDAHFPYTPPPPYDTLFPGKRERIGLEQYHDLEVRILQQEQRITEAERRHLVSQYDGGIAYLDSQLGALFAKLRQLGLYDNCLLIVTSDHGEAFGERHLIGHGVSVYQDQVHIPLIIKYPNFARKGVDNRLVSLIDIFPTVLEAAGCPAPKGIDGQSLLQPRTGRARVAIAESFPGARLVNWNHRFRIERALFNGRFKLISGAGIQELYDLSQDPGERKNLYHDRIADARGLEAALKSWVAAASAAVPGSQVDLDDDAVQRLRSLGYVQ